jgi:hypothetical protein
MDRCYPCLRGGYPAPGPPSAQRCQSYSPPFDVWSQWDSLRLAASTVVVGPEVALFVSPCRFDSLATLSFLLLPPAGNCWREAALILVGPDDSRVPPLFCCCPARGNPASLAKTLWPSYAVWPNGIEPSGSFIYSGQFDKLFGQQGFARPLIFLVGPSYCPSACIIGSSPGFPLLFLPATIIVSLFSLVSESFSLGPTLSKGGRVEVPW